VDLSVEKTSKFLRKVHETQKTFQNLRRQTDIKVAMNFALAAAPPMKEIIDGIMYVLEEHPEKLNQYISHEHNVLPSEVIISFLEEHFNIIQVNGKRLGSDNILLGQGAMTLTLESVRQTVGPDGLLFVPYPTYGAFLSAMEFLRPEQIVLLPTREENRFMVVPEQLKEAMSEGKRRSGKAHPKAVFLSIDPHNPTMKIAKLEDKERLVPIMMAEGIHIIDDRVYDGTQHDKNPIPAYGAFSELANKGQVTTIYSLGKALGGANIKAGFAVGNSEVLHGMGAYMCERFRYVDVTAQGAMAFVLADRAKSHREKYQQEMVVRARFGQRLMRALVEGGLTREGAEELERIDGTNFCEMTRKENPELWLQIIRLMKDGVNGIRFEGESVAGHTQLLNISDLFGKYHNGEAVQISVDVARVFASEGILVYPGDSFLYPGTVRVNFSIEASELVLGILGMERAIGRLKENPF